MCPDKPFETISFSTDTDLSVQIEVRLTESVPVRGHNISSGNLCASFSTDEQEGLQKIKISCAPNQVPFTPGTTYLTFQAKNFTSLQIKDVQFG